MTTFRTEMITQINNLKLKGLDEDSIYRRYLDGKNLENGDEEASEQEIKDRVNYLKRMTDNYLDLW